MPRIFKRNSLAVLADVLTVARGLGAPIVLAIIRGLGIKSFTWLSGTFLLGILTDIYDGLLARKAKQPSKIGDYEILSDLSLIASVVLYIMTSFTLHNLLLGMMAFWLLLAFLSLYGTLRNKSWSFIFLTQSPAAGCLGFSIFFYVLIHKIVLGHSRNLADIIFFGIAILHLAFIPSSGFKAMKRVSEKTSRFREEFENIKRGLKNILQKR
jgi:phosphatidylglycerophosphate synthase